jgi:phasin
MDTKTNPTATKPAEAYQKMSAATTEATDLIKDSCSTAVKGAQAYNNKLLEFAQANTNVAFDFAQRLLGLKSPSDFIELATEHARKQFESLTEQTRELATLGQKVALTTTEPLKTSITKSFGRAA